jgi:O-antigen ligase
LLLASIVLGGATRSGYLGDVLLQLLAVPALLLAAWLWLDRLGADASRRNPWSAELLLGLAMAACGLIILLAQAVPLFGTLGWAGISAHLAAAGAAPEGLAATGSSSVDPAMSLAAVAAVIPPLALFLLVSALPGEQRLRLLGGFVVFGLVSLVIGVLQVLQGPDSPLRFFAISNREEAVGFFANRNHFAAQLYVTLLLGVAWLAAREERLLSSRTPTARKVLWLAGVFCVALLLLAGIALARSRAGILLALVAAAAVVAMSPTLIAALRGRERRPRRVRGIIFAVIAALLLLVGQLGADRFLSRFDAGLVDQMRATLNTVTLRAVGEALPFGTGLGTFPSVYAVYEGSQDLRPEYVNRAHDDWLEFPLETGIAGMLLVALFVAWFALRAFHIWIRPAPGEGTRLLIMQQCAALAVLLLMLHSIVDYPLRTATMLAYFAACCALMTPVRKVSGAFATDEPVRETGRRARGGEAPASTPVLPVRP